MALRILGIDLGSSSVKIVEVLSGFRTVELVGMWWCGGLEAVVTKRRQVGWEASTGAGGARMGGRRVRREQVMSTILGRLASGIRRWPSRSSAKLGIDGERKSAARGRC